MSFYLLLQKLLRFLEPEFYLIADDFHLGNIY